MRYLLLSIFLIGCISPIYKDIDDMTRVDMVVWMSRNSCGYASDVAALEAQMAWYDVRIRELCLGRDCDMASYSRRQGELRELMYPVVVEFRKEFCRGT